MAIIKLQTSDGKTIPMEKSAAEMCGTLKGLVEEGVHLNNGDGKPIPLEEVDSVTLMDVIEYCQKKRALQSAAEFEAWEKEFKEQIDNFPKLFRLINASDYLDIKGLIELTTQKAVEMMKDLSLDAVRSLFKLPNDFPKEKEARLRERFGWAFQR